MDGIFGPYFSFPFYNIFTDLQCILRFLVFTYVYNAYMYRVYVMCESCIEAAFEIGSNFSGINHVCICMCVCRQRGHSVEVRRLLFWSRHYDRGYSVEVRRSLFWSTSSGQCWSYSGKSGTNDMDDRTALWRRVNKVNEDRGEGGNSPLYII